jgi:ABC-type branched-subunit amino acid transport system substrate-binding protein
MSKIKRISFIFTLVVLLAVLVVSGACGPQTPATTTPTEPTTPSTPAAKPVTLYIGGGFALTGAYAEDMAAVLAGFEYYAKYVNETHKIAPWSNETFPENATLEVLWRDDELKPEKALAQYDELKDKGILVWRITGSPEALALKDVLMEDNMGATTAATGPYLLTPPQTIFTNYPIYTDGGAAVGDWFMANWKEDRKPRFAYLTADNASGKSVVIPELTAYLESIGFEVVGEQYVPLVPTSPPTTQLTWLKENGVDLAYGFMINPGSQPTIKEANRLGMGPGLDYEITFAFPTPSHLQVFVPAMGELGNGAVVAGGYPSWDDPCAGMQFIHQLQDKYRPDKPITHIMYVCGIIEAMTQVEAQRLAMASGVPGDQLTCKDVLEKGFYQIKDFSTGELTNTPLTYGLGDVEGVDQVRIDQVQNGKIVKQGTYPTRHIYAK